MGRSPLSSSSGDESGLKKGPWTPEEDEKLINYIQKHGHGSWRALPKLAGLNRCGKSCRLRWTNYLRPDIKRGKFSQEEEQTILNLHSILGNKWSAIATHLPGRTDNEIKNFWNTHLKKKLIQMGFDPMTHRPRTDIFSTLPHLIALANLIENPTWEDQAIRLQAEAIQMARLNTCLQNLLQPQPPTTTFPHLLNNNSQPFDHLIPSAANFNLFNSLKENSVLSQLESAPAEFLMEPMGQFAHMPDLRAPCSGGVENGQGGCFGKGHVSDFDGLVSNEHVTESSITNNNTVDGSSGSSYGGTQMWSQLLDDPIFNDIV